MEVFDINHLWTEVDKNTIIINTTHADANILHLFNNILRLNSSSVQYVRHNIYFRVIYYAEMAVI